MSAIRKFEELKQSATNFPCRKKGGLKKRRGLTIAAPTHCASHQKSTC